VIPGSLSERALVHAPRGRDAAIAAAMLSEGRIEASVCPTLPALIAELAAGAAFVLITEESIATSDLQPLSRWLGQQEEWSDMPFILLTSRGGGLERNPAAGRFLELLGNVTFLERPFHPTTLISLARSAVRGRRRQYDARARLIALRELNDTLERRVQDALVEREAAMDQLHEAQKLETIGQLTGGVAHDFNNLLTPITGVLDLLAKRYHDDERSARLIDGAMQSAERARVLVQRLLGFARRQVLATNAVSLSELVEGMRDLIASSVGPAIELRIIAPDDLPMAWVDPNQMELAILNLCVNARDAMPKGGELTIAVEQAVIGPDSALPLPLGIYLRLSVIDTGTGMDERTLARAVEPFYSTKEVGKGTGLGLSMVHGLLAQLGGTFVLTSTLGSGTRADLYVRVADAKSAPRRLPEQEAESPHIDPRLAIMVVDDEDLVRAGTAEMLRDLGHTVYEASGGPQALEILKAGTAIDVVVTDYMMPRMDGGELAAQIGESHPDLPILVVTGYAGGDLEIDLPQLAKPFRQADLRAAIRNLLNSNVVQFTARRG
jgi:signal transduction histidine kinase/CheY-like chemotaxis protein